MKKNLLLMLFAMLFSKFSFGQTGCKEALQQLSSYSAQINKAYSNEYNTIIPSKRCPANNAATGQRLDPMFVQNCRIQMYSNLNEWYGQECNYVNNAYAQIVKWCSTKPQSTTVKPAPTQIYGGDLGDQIDTDKIEQTTAAVDGNKTVRITIPETASGFNPN